MTRPMVHQFSEVYRTDAGHKVRVEMQDAPDISQEADFQPRKIAVVAKSPFVQPGTVITYLDASYLLFEQVSLPKLNRFRAYEITHRLPWVRNTIVQDPVTGFDKSSGPQTLSPTLPVVVEPVRTIKELGIERPKVNVYSGADVQVGDLIGPYQVHSVVHMLGVKLLEVF